MHSATRNPLRGTRKAAASPAGLFFGFQRRGGGIMRTGVLQIVFNEISAAELSGLDTLEQLELLEEFKVGKEDLENLSGERFGKIERDGTVLYRYRSKDYRFYFEVKEGAVIVHRVLHKGTFSDFLFRSKMPLVEDEALAGSKHFWKLIDEGRNARRL
jgi:mRNA-degrading endonuclease RelE of RelBE toxin-antitoxin system